MVATHNQAKTIFGQAIAIESAEERSRFLDDACKDDDNLRSEVEQLLIAFQGVGSFMEEPAVGCSPTVDLPSVHERPGSEIGHYKLMEQIGEGGMGVVYVAVQQQPVKRKVALKIVKPGMDSKEIIARFEAERQALAMMDHENIAKVLDAGTTGGGRPYFVMELVKGIAITEYCDRNQLSIRQRLELFVQVCQAAQHAHQKGIIHRDLKPSNVLVRLHDETPVPKVIDFGVAKALHHQLTDRTIYTRFAQVIGTPLYMSPEQAELGGVDIDTRTDVYSLGVLLYELLTGVTPFDKQRFEKAAYDEIRRIIREDEPPKPSTRISTLGDNLKTVSQNRKIDRKRLGHVLHGELDWIVMKALEKDRTRRYETALGFANDVQRFLNEEAVLACPPSTTYRLRKFLWRNRGPVIAASALLLVLCLGLVGTTIGLVWATREARNARLARDQAQQMADQNQKLAEQEREARSKAEYGSYVLQIRLAASNLGQGNAMVARQALLATPPEYRKWEWGYLVGQAWSPKTEFDPGEIVTRGPDVSAAEFWTSAPAHVINKLDHDRHKALGTIVFSSDGMRIATTSTDGTVHLWNARTGVRTGSFSTGGYSQALAFSHNNSRIAICRTTGETSMVDAETTNTIWTKPAPNARAVDGFWFSPDDTRLVAAHFDGPVAVWETESGRLIHSYDKHPSVVQSLRFLARGKSVISASRDGSVRVWELETGHESEAPRFAPRRDRLRVQAISPNLREIAAGFYDGSILLWNWETGEKKADLRQGAASVEDLVFSPDGSCLFAMEGQEAVRLLDTTSGELIGIVDGVLQERKSIALSPDGTQVAMNSRDGTTSIWAPVLLETAERRTLRDAHDDVVIQAAFSPDGKRIVTASYDKKARVWDAENQELLCTFHGHQHELLKAEFSPDGRRVASVSCRGTVRVWDAETGKEIFSRGGSEEFYRAAVSASGLRGHILNYSAGFSPSPFAPTGTELVINEGQDMVVVDSRDGHVLRTLQDNPTIGWPIIDPFAKCVATITETLEVVHVWELNTGNKLKILSGHDGQAYWAEFSRDGSRTVTSSMDSTAIIWDTQTWEPLQRLRGHEGNVRIARFSPDGGRIATASADGTSRVWDASTGDLLSVFYGHPDRLTNVEFSPDGTRILTTAQDDTVRIWVPENPEARELVQLSGSSKLVYGTWSPDGRQVLTCWLDGSVRLFAAFPWDDVAMSDKASNSLDNRVRVWRESRSTQ